MSVLLRYCMVAGAAWGGFAPGAVASSEQRFAEAQSRFDAAKRKLEASAGDPVETRRTFYEAATQFAGLADEGIASVNLYVNAGNAYHFAGDDPRALLWYLRASRLANTPETRSGLATLRRVCKADLWPHEQASIGRALMFWHYDLSRRVKQTLLLAVYPIGCGLVIVGLFVKRRPLWLRLGVGLIVIGGTLGVSDVVTATAPGPPWAVVLESAKGYAGDGESYSVVVEALTAGQEVQVIESRGPWVQVELPSRTRCWLRADACEEV